MDWYEQEMQRMMRHEKKLHGFDTDHPRCVLCGRDDPAGLELHHIAGAANSTLTVSLCGYCHALVSDRQIDLMSALLERDVDRDPHQRQAALLYGAAILLILLAIAFIAWANWNMAASAHLASQYGADWWKSIPVEAPK